MEAHYTRLFTDDQGESCFEVRRFLNADFDARFSSLLDDWRVYMRRVIATP